MKNRASAPQQRTHFDESQQRSRRTVQPIGGNAGAERNGFGSELFADDIDLLDRDCRRYHARKEGV